MITLILNNIMVSSLLLLTHKTKHQSPLPPLNDHTSDRQALLVITVSADCGNREVTVTSGCSYRLPVSLALLHMFYMGVCKLCICSPPQHHNHPHTWKVDACCHSIQWRLTCGLFCVRLMLCWLESYVVNSVFVNWTYEPNCRHVMQIQRQRLFKWKIKKHL